MRTEEKIMSGIQFIRYEKYTLAESSNILAEAKRMEGYCDHVPNPKDPVVISGDLDELDNYLKKAVPEFKMPYVMHKDGKEFTGKRGIRKDANVLMGLIASFPRQDAKPGDPDFEEWKGLLLKHTQKKYGSQVKAVVAHFDESHPHLHIYIVPDGFDMTRVCAHDAAVKLAKTECKAKPDITKKQASAIQMNAGKQALREWQDEFYSEVSFKCGHARLGPRRRRLSRQEWVDDQACNDLVATCAKRSQNAVKNTKQQNLQLTADLNKARADASHYKQEAEEAQLMIGAMTGLGDAPASKPKPTPAPSTTYSVPDLGEFGL